MGFNHTLNKDSVQLIFDSAVANDSTNATVETDNQLNESDASALARIITFFYKRSKMPPAEWSDDIYNTIFEVFEYYKQGTETHGFDKEEVLAGLEGQLDSLIQENH